MSVNNWIAVINACAGKYEFAAPISAILALLLRDSLAGQLPAMAFSLIG